LRRTLRGNVCGSKDPDSDTGKTDTEKQKRLLHGFSSNCLIWVRSSLAADRRTDGTLVLSARLGPRLRAGHAPSTIDSKHTNDERDPSVNCPLRLASHKAAWQNVDTLKEPNRSEKHEQDTNDD
jgi:hypothetical protein